MKNKFFFISLITLGFIFAFAVKSNAACSVIVKPSVSEIDAGKSFKVTITVSGGAGSVNLSASNGSLSSSATDFLDNSSEVVTCTAGSTEGEYITISASGLIGDYETEKDVTKSGSAKVKIKEKVVEKVTSDPEPTQTPTTSTTTKKESTTTKTETKKEEKEEKPEIYINSVSIKGIKENGEEIAIPLSSEFKGDDYEYLCIIPGDVVKIKIDKEAGDYTNNIIVDGADELKEGENVITLTLSVEDYKAKKYTITATKEPKKEVRKEEIKTENLIEDTVVTSNKPVEKNEVAMISMPVGVFVAMIAGIVTSEFVIIKLIPWQNIRKTKKD